MSKNHYLSFIDQTRRYFDRPHNGVPTAPIDHPAAWKGCDIAQDDWLITLTAQEIAEIDNAVDSVLRAGFPLKEVTKQRFELPTLAPRLGDWVQQLVHGIGVLVLRGLPVNDWGLERAQVAFWGLGHYLGLPGAQNPEEELLGHVTDYGEANSNPHVRLYRTTANINFHCDAADVVGLMCLQPAQSGGQSRIVSTVSLFNALLGAHPELVPDFFEPFMSDRRDRLPAGAAPFGWVRAGCFDGADLKTFYHSEYFRSVERHEGVQIPQEQKAILDFYDQLAEQKDLHLDISLLPGDMQFLSNHHIAHARTAYEDDPAPTKKRHLLRLWLSV